MLSRTELVDLIHKLSARKFVVLRMIRLRRLTKRLEAFDTF